jgi:hypothetical protein
MINDRILFCDFDHNGECLTCDCWPDSCGYLRYMNQDYKWETREQLQEMFKNEKMTKLGLINYEGDCLKAIKEDGEILIQDQYGVIVERFDVPQLYGFIDGLINVVDSKGKSWNYSNESKDAKPSYSMIYHFVKDLK